MYRSREDAVRRALELTPGSLRAFAEDAGISEALLRHIRDGRKAATPRTLHRLIHALESRREAEAEAVRALRAALDGP